jgi:hypothetical protein
MTDHLYEEITQLRERVAELERANQSAAVCRDHTSEFIGEDCLVCRNDRLRAVVRAAKSVYCPCDFCECHAPIATALAQLHEGDDEWPAG